jgi:hypothetical protein
VAPVRARGPIAPASSGEPAGASSARARRGLVAAASFEAAGAAPTRDRVLIVTAPFGEAAGAAPARDHRPTGRAAAAAQALASPTRTTLVAVAAVLAVAGGLAGWRIGRAGGPSTRVPAVIRATFAGVDYRLLGVEVSRRIPQPGGAVPASGVFEIVRLELRAADRRPHVVSSDLLTLEAGPTSYGASSPDDLGLTDRRWGAVAAATPVPAGGTLTVKAVFDVPAGVVGRATALHIGPFDYVDQAAPTLALPRSSGCCRSAGPGSLASLRPSPVLG